MHEPLLTLSAGVYFLSTLAYFAYLSRSDARIAQAARWAFGLGFVVHTIAIGVRCSRGLPPTLTAPDTLSFSSWALAAGFLAVQLRWKLPPVGAFVSPLVCVLVLVAVLLPRPLIDPSDAYRSLWFPIHVVMAVGGCVAFVLAAALGVMYLIQEKNLKAKRTTPLSRRLPNLEILDAVGHRLVTIGFPMLTLGLLTGAFWIRARPDLGLGPLAPKVIWAVFTWVLYAVLLNGRMLMGLRGRKAAILSIAGFGLVLASFASLSVFAP